MNHYLPRLVVATILLVVGYKPLMQSNVFSFTSNSSSIDNYEVQWTGLSGSKLFGSYVIVSKNLSTPSRVEKVTATLPYRVKFSAEKNTLISVAGTTNHQGEVQIKIFKNGSECGQTTLIGSGAMSNKTCQ